MPKFTQRCSTNLSSSTKVPSSKRRPSLSRAVSLPVAFTFSRALAPPPSSIFFSRALMSSIFSLFVTAFLLFVFWNGLERRLFPLAQLEQHAAGGTGVHEGDLRAARGVAGLLVNEPHAQGLELRQGRLEVVDSQRHVLDAFAVLVDVLGYEAVRRRGLEQLDLGLADGEEGHAHFLLGHLFDTHGLQPHRFIDLQGFGDAFHCDSDVIYTRNLHVD